MHDDGKIDGHDRTGVSAWKNKSISKSETLVVDCMN